MMKNGKTKSNKNGKKSEESVNPIEFVRNVYGLRIKKCCASCAYKDETRSTRKRKCTMSGKDVFPCDCCKAWKMSNLMIRAGKGKKGQVKRFDYLMYVLTEREEMLMVGTEEEPVSECEDAPEAETIDIETKGIGEIRMKFEQEHGSIYINKNKN